MKEQLITYEVAKLAKEKGFKPASEWNPEYVPGYKDYGFIFDEPEKGVVLDEFKEEDYSCEGYYLAPSQTLLLKWLREEHNINIVIIPTFACYNIGIYKYSTLTDMNLNLDLNGLEFKDFTVYEDAIEAALFKAFEFVN